MDFKKAESFFQVDINPLASNPLNLYDDVHNAFIVNLFKGSDKVCFYVLSEFRKAINYNVTMLSVIFSLIASSLIGSLVGIGLIATRRREWSARLPYGPYIAVAAAIWIFGGKYFFETMFGQ